jgi:hypothetical protein
MSKNLYPQYIAIALSLTFLVTAMPSEAGRHSDKGATAHSNFSQQQQAGGTRYSGVGGGRGPDRMHAVKTSGSETAEFAVMEASESADMNKNMRTHSQGGRGPDHR